MKKPISSRSQISHVTISSRRQVHAPNFKFEITSIFTAMDLPRRCSPRLNKIVQSSTISSFSNAMKTNIEKYSSGDSPNAYRIPSSRQRKSVVSSTNDKEKAMIARPTTLSKSASLYSLNPLSTLNMRQLRIGAIKTAQSFRTTFDSLSQVSH